MTVHVEIIGRRSEEHVVLVLTALTGSLGYCSLGRVRQAGFGLGFPGEVFPGLLS